VPAPETDGDRSARLSVLRDDRAVIGASDAGAHLDMLATFSYATTLLGACVREHGMLPLEEAVYRLTDVPARLYGLRDRGRLVPGAYADLVVFDPATVGTRPVETRFDLPGGAGRLYSEADGIGHVVVNGAEIVTDGSFTDERPGTLLRSGRDTANPDMS
jgi:N-acyl-D-aspartate/D-glutamate deacylase